MSAPPIFHRISTQAEAAPRRHMPYYAKSHDRA
jgi:hypothetical protein